VAGGERAVVAGMTALAAANALNAWRPFDRHGRGSLASFFAGWPTSELPLAALGAHLALAGVAARRGDFAGRLGAASAATGAGVAGLLLRLRQQAATADPAFAAALAEGLGKDWRDGVAQPRFPGPDVEPAAVGAVRMVRIRRRYAHAADLRYGPEGPSNLLDVWSREDLPAAGRAPVLVQVPGGAWITGNKQGQACPLMSHLAERGWVCVAINYRLGPRHPWPAQIVDVKRAIAWVRANIASYGGDPDFIAVTGGSAGGHLSALAALTAGDTQWQPGFEDADTSVAAAVPFYGVYDFVDEDRIGNRGLVPLAQRHLFHAKLREQPELFRAASPLHRIHPGAPPFLVVHGSNDSLVPVEQGRLFAARLRAVSSAAVVYAELPGAQHAFDVFGSPRAQSAARAVAGFLGHAYGRHLARIDSASTP
jgi:acetyl esterase/lipase